MARPGRRSSVAPGARCPQTGVASSATSRMPSSVGERYRRRRPPRPARAGVNCRRYPVRAVQRGQVPVTPQQRRQGGRLRGPQPFPPDLLPADQPADLLVRNHRVGDDGQDRVQRRLPVFPDFARSARASRILCPALFSRADTAWSNNCTISSSASVADYASNVSRIGYRRSGSRRCNACAVNGPPSPETGAAPPAAPTNPGCERLLLRRFRR